MSNAAKSGGKANQGRVAVKCSNVTAESTDTHSSEDENSSGDGALHAKEDP